MNKNGYFQSDKDGNVTKAPPKKQPPPFSGGVTSWNDLQDRPFGESVETVEFLPETVCFFQSMPSLETNMMPGGTIPSQYDLVVGQTYIVTWDGVEYECVAKEVSNSTVPVLGNENYSWSNYDGTGEPFYISASVQWGFTMYTPVSDGEHTVAIRTMQTITKPLDAKYLPNMRINITATEDDEGNVSYNADRTYDEITECIQAGGLPYCVMGERVLTLCSSSVISEVSTYGALAARHDFSCIISATSFNVMMLDTGNVSYREYVLTTAVT